MSPRSLTLAPAHPDPMSESAPVLEEFTSPGLSLTQIFAILRAYWKHSAIIATAVTLAVCIYAKLLPKTYVATATLMVNYEINEGGKQYAVNALGSYVSTQIDLMRSAEVLMPVIDRLRLADDTEFAAGYSGDGNTLGYYLQESLRKKVEIAQGAGGNQLVFLTANAHDPVKAANIANAIADTYIEKSREWIRGPANERAQSYYQQLAELQQKVKIAQDKVTGFRQSTGITDVAVGGDDMEMQLLSNLETRLQEAQGARRAAEARRAASGPSTSDVLDSVLVQGLKTQLSAQEAQLSQLSATLGERHPKVLELRSQIQATRKSLEIEVGNYSNSRSAELEMARQLESKIARAADEQRTKVLAERKIRDEGSKLLLELEAAQAVYKRALDGYDQVILPTGGERNNVSFVSRAAPPVNSDRPNKKKLAALGLFAGMFLGLIGPLAHELFFSRRIRCRHDFERNLGLPVLAEFAMFEPAKLSA